MDFLRFKRWSKKILSRKGLRQPKFTSQFLYSNVSIKTWKTSGLLFNHQQQNHNATQSLRTQTNAYHRKVLFSFFWQGARMVSKKRIKKFLQLQETLKTNIQKTKVKKRIGSKQDETWEVIPEETTDNKKLDLRNLLKQYFLQRLPLHLKQIFSSETWHRYLEDQRERATNKTKVLKFRKNPDKNFI